GAMNPFVGGFNPLAFGLTPVTNPMAQAFGINPLAISPIGMVNPYLAHSFGSPLTAHSQLGVNPLWAGIGTNPFLQNPLGINPMGVTQFGTTPFGVNPGISPFGVNPLGINPVGVTPFGTTPFGVNPGISPFGVNPLGVSPFGASPLGISQFGVNPLGFNPLGFNPLGVNPFAVNPLAGINPAINPSQTAFPIPFGGINPLANPAITGQATGFPGLGFDPVTEAIASQAIPYPPIRSLIPQHQQHGGLPFPGIAQIGQFTDPITASLIQSQLLAGIVHNPLLGGGRIPWAAALSNPFYPLHSGQAFGANQFGTPGCV
ncbi:MAG: hypothetical protein ACREAC_19625, partial [Blastocatellia bacterium]